MLTLYYGAPSGCSLTVTWVEMSTARRRSARIDARAIDGHTVLVAHDQTAMAVVAGTAAPADLRRASEPPQRGGSSEWSAPSSRARLAHM